MSDARETILNRVRGALAPLKERAAYPQYADDVATMHQLLDGRDPVAVFTERIKVVNGLALDSTAQVATWLQEKGWTRGYCDPALWPELAPAFGPEFKVETTFDRTRVDDYQFGITRAAGAIAEIGVIILKDRSTSTRLGALAPWVHIAVVRRSEVLASLAQAVAAFGDDPNVIWCAGPSKTADIEGILIEGVHGPGQQIALVL
jgi:L-lactate dehydrogenase complex protein LldG